MADETPVMMPALGESVVEGTINKWLKKVGEHVDEDELLVEVTTDKVNTEIPSVASGTLTQIIAQEGEIVKVGSPMCIISSNGASAPAADPAPQLAAEVHEEDTGLYPVDPANVITLPSPKKAEPAVAVSNDAARFREKSSPLVRRILAENNLDLSTIDLIAGTGQDGRVTKEDALSYIEAQKKSPSPVSVAVAPVATAPPPTTTAAMFANPGVTVPTDTDSVITPLAGIRKVIADRLSYSEHIAPHVTTFTEVDVTDLVALRARYKDWAKEEEKVNLTYMPFIIKAICAGLHVFPTLNSSLQDNQLYQHKRIHMAVAVSLDGAGLILPIIKDADRLGIIDLARAVSDLAARARDNKLKPDEVRGSTFTISNPGAFGGLISTPVINQPNAAILNTGKIMKMPWVMPDDSIVPRSIMYLSLSYDHRIVDGETSVKFLQYVKKSLEQFDKFLLR